VNRAKNSVFPLLLVRDTLQQQDNTIQGFTIFLSCSGMQVSITTKSNQKAPERNSHTAVC